MKRSEKRKRTRVIYARCLPAEVVEVKRAAEACGMTVSEFVRTAALGAADAVDAE